MKRAWLCVALGEVPGSMSYRRGTRVPGEVVSICFAHLCSREGAGLYATCLVLGKVCGSHRV